MSAAALHPASRMSDCLSSRRMRPTSITTDTLCCRANPEDQPGPVLRPDYTYTPPLRPRPTTHPHHAHPHADPLRDLPAYACMIQETNAANA